MTTDNVNLRSKAYQTLKNKIMTLAYTPGEKISLQSIIIDIGIGKTPIHEALVQLNQEDLIQMIPQSGTYISKINLHTAHEARFTRELIEVEIMQEAAVAITSKDKNFLQELLKQQKLAITTGTTENIFDLDDEFHHYFYSLTQHDDMWQWLKMCSTHLTRFRRLRIQTSTLDWLLILEQHRDLLTDTINHDLGKIRFDELKHIRLMLNEENEVRKQFPDYFD